MIFKAKILMDEEGVLLCFGDHAFLQNGILQVLQALLLDT
jgi:hypothetical protein